MTVWSDARAELLNVERQRQRAMIAADIPALASLLAEDLTHVHSTGMVHNKTQFLEHVRRMGGFVSIDRGDPEIRLEGNIAILSGETCNKVRSLETGEVMTRHGFSTLVLRRELSGWHIVLSQMTPHRA